MLTNTNLADGLSARMRQQAKNLDRTQVITANLLANGASRIDHLTTAHQQTQTIALVLWKSLTSEQIETVLGEYPQIVDLMSAMQNELEHNPNNSLALTNPLEDTNSNGAENVEHPGELLDIIEGSEQHPSWEGDVPPGRTLLRERMLEAISDYSERRWAAGWMSGIEEDVRREGGHWVLLAAGCGGWPVGYRAEGGWDPLTESEHKEVQRLLGHFDP